MTKKPSDKFIWKRNTWDDPDRENTFDLFEPHREVGDLHAGYLKRVGDDDLSDDQSEWIFFPFDRCPNHDLLLRLWENGHSIKGLREALDFINSKIDSAA